MTFGPGTTVQKNYAVPMMLVAPCGITMGQIVVTVALTMVLLGCSGSSQSPAVAGFINQTRHSDADLQAIWKGAQQSLAQQIDLNPLQQLSKSVSADMRPGDPRKLSRRGRDRFYLRTLQHFGRLLPADARLFRT